MKYAVEMSLFGMIYIYIKFPNNLFRYLSNIKVITSTTSEAVVLVLLMGMIYEVRCGDGLVRHDICTKFHSDLFRHSSNIKFITATISEVVVLVLPMARIYEVCR
jgi:hypothetical protein